MEEMCHNPYFSRWFSAICNKAGLSNRLIDSHNPYFSRWFSAIINNNKEIVLEKVTILILVDGFLQ